MDKPISVGDLVQVVRVDHSCAERLLGKIWRVGHIPVSHPGIRCQICGQPDIAKADSAVASKETGSFRGLPQRWLKRIPPAEELGIVGEDEKLREPA